MVTTNSMQITKEGNTLTVHYAHPLSYCDNTASNTTVGRVL